LDAPVYFGNAIKILYGKLIRVKIRNGGGDVLHPVSERVRGCNRGGFIHGQVD